MNKTYWTLFYLSLITLIAFITITILGIIFIKKIFLSKRNGIVYFIVSMLILVFLTILSANHFVLCLKDYNYASNNTYLEAKAKVVEFTNIKKDLDGDGKIHYSKPKFLLIETGEYIVLYAKNVSQGETYIIRYYPNTKICEVVENIN